MKGSPLSASLSQPGFECPDEDAFDRVVPPTNGLGDLRWIECLACLGVVIGIKEVLLRTGQPVPNGQRAIRLLKAQLLEARDEPRAQRCCRAQELRIYDGTPLLVIG